MIKLEQIIESENNLLAAVRNNDIAALDGLIHADLIFNIPNGHTITKELDLQNYKSGAIKIEHLISSDQKIKVIDDIATVVVTVHLIGQYMENALDQKFRYLRVWKLFDGEWKVIAGSSQNLNNLI